MKKLLLLSVLFLFPAAQADMRILACEPEWGALAKEIGGAKVKVHNATTAKQDPHHIEARPSLIAKARRADMLLCTGAELETGWLPLLLQKSANTKIQAGKPGHFMATDYVKMLEVLGKVDRSMGDVHAAGNPHIQTDPRRVLQVADALVGKMKSVDPGNAAHYQQGYQRFKQRWQQAMQKWQQQAQSVRGMPIVVHHRSWVYLEDWLGLKEVTALEPKPGIPPSTAHLASVLQALKKTPAKVIIYSEYQNPRSANWLSKQSGIPAVQLPASVGGSSATQDLFALFDSIVKRLTQVKG